MQGKLNLVVHRGISIEFAREVGTLSVDEKTLKAVAAEGKLRRFIFQVKEIMKDRQKLRRILSAIKKEGLSLTSGINVLLQAKEEILGLLTLSSHVPRRFSEAERNLLISIAQQIAVAIQNSRLYELSQRELTERKQTEAKLRESEEHYRELADSIADVFFAMDKELNYTYWNKASENLTGIPAKDAIGKSLYEIFPEIKGTEAEKIYLDVLRTQHSQSLVNPYKIKGKNFYFEISAYPSMHGLSVFVKDITERKKAEEEKERLRAQLIQSEKMAGIGTLASGIAHEFNNLLQIMSGHTEFARKTKKAEDMEEALNIVLDTSERASKMIRDLATFSKQDIGKKDLCSIKGPIESVFSLTEDQLKKNNIKLVKKYGKTSRVNIDKGEIQQVFLNMVMNARDAMLPKGGKLEVRLREIKGNVEVSFADTGIGIEKENLGKVFEPFYTTKGAVGGRSDISGTGLGLSVSYGIVRRHGGTIEVESERGKGTTFTVKLPVKKVRHKKIGKDQRQKQKRAYL